MDCVVADAGRRPFAEECNGAKNAAMSANAVNQAALKRPW